MQTKLKEFNLKEVVNRSTIGKNNFSIELDYVKTLTTDILNNCIIFNNVGDLLSGILPGVDLTNINTDILKYKNYDNFTVIDNLIFLDTINYFIDSIAKGDLEETKRELLDMMVNFIQIPHDIAYGIIDGIDLTTINAGKKITITDDDVKDKFQKQEEYLNQGEIVSENDIIDFKNKITKHAKKGKIIECLLTDEFNFKDVNIFFQRYSLYLKKKHENLDDFSYLGSGKSAGAFVHVLNLVNQEKYGIKNKAYQIAIEDQDMMNIHIGSSTMYPQGDGLILFEYNEINASFTGGILSTLLESDIRGETYNNSSIVDIFPLVLLEGNKAKDYKLNSPMNYDNKDKGLSTDINSIDLKTIETVLSRYQYYVKDNNIDKQFFHTDEFVGLQRLDKNRIMNSSEYVLIAAIVIYNDILKNKDLSNHIDLHLHYIKELEYSVIFMIGLLIKKDYPNINIITDKMETLDYIEGDNFNEDNLLDIKLFSNEFNEDEYILDSMISGKHVFEDTFSIYSDRFDEIKL